MDKYNRTRINGLDARQLVYVSFHTEEYGTQQLVINGETYMDRASQNKPSDEDIKKALAGYEDREAFLDCNMRGWAIVFKTDANEEMYRWELMTKIQ